MNEPVLYRLKDLRHRNVISVSKTPFRIGRATTNDLAIPTNRYLSSCHCVFEFDQGRIWLRDTSSNGILINRQKKLNKTDPPIELHEGDILHLVFRKDEADANVILQVEFSSTNRSSDSTLKRKLSGTLASPAAADETKENIDLSQLLNASSTANESLTTAMRDEMEDVLTCVCCQDLLKNPICLEPCLHAFCSDCYSSWEKIQRTCPKCRAKVTNKKKNVMINGILDAYLKAHPDKSSVSKTIDDGRVTKMAKTASTKTPPVKPDQVQMNNNNQQQDNQLLVIMSTLTNESFVCRQCPTTQSPTTTTSSNAFQCRPNQVHLLCQCCAQLMPDRQDEPAVHQSCELCHQHFCHLYFGQCQRVGCLGCLNQLRNFKFSPRHLANLVNDNPVETQIVHSYLNGRQLTVDDFFGECCQRLDRQEFKYAGFNRNGPDVPSKRVVCYQCGLTVFKDLAYQFRVSMRMTDIVPPVLRHRENCYYGKECRTQYTKPAHAQKLNHACQQSRFD